MELIKSKSFPRNLAIALFIIGIIIVATQFIWPIPQQDVALKVAGAGFILSGFIQFGQAYNTEQIIGKLNEIQQELEKIEQPKSIGVAIANVITAGLKCYSEHMTKSKKEEEK